MVLNLQTSSVFAAWKISVVRCLKQKPQDVMWKKTQRQGDLKKGFRVLTNELQNETCNTQFICFPDRLH